MPNNQTGILALSDVLDFSDMVVEIVGHESDGHFTLMRINAPEFHCCEGDDDPSIDADRHMCPNEPTWALSNRVSIDYFCVACLIHWLGEADAGNYGLRVVSGAIHLRVKEG